MVRVIAATFASRRNSGVTAMLVRSHSETGCELGALTSATNMSLPQLLVVDKSSQIRKACCEVAEGLGFTASEAENETAAHQVLKRKEIAVLLLDMSRVESEGWSFLKELKALYPGTLFIAMSSCATIFSAVEAMRIGACDYLSKPFPLHVLTESLERVARRWHFETERRQVGSEIGMSDLLGRSPEMEKLYRILSRVADSTHPVMVLGESGTGKTLVAQSIHSNGRDASKPFVSLDCKSLGPALLGDTLFGSTKDSQSRANKAKQGLLTSPQVGTVFLDEIEDFPLDLQKKLVVVLNGKSIRPTGGERAVPISVRIVAATGRDLTEMVRTGLFRMDLYRLLSVVNLRIPPLRGRPDDIAFLAQRFLEKIQRQTGLTHSLSDETLRMLETYDWPDNVRELESTIVRACEQAPGPKLEALHLPQRLINFHRTTGLTSKPPLNSTTISLEESIIPIAKMEKHAILEAMRQTNGNKLMAAKLLGIGKTTLYRKLVEYGLSEKTNGGTALVSSATSTNNLSKTESAPICA